MDEEPRSTSARTAYLSIFLASVVLFAMYNAALTSFLAVFKLQMPFTNINELYLDTDYRVALQDETAIIQMLRDASGIEKKISDERLDVIISLDEGIAKMKEGNVAVLFDNTAMAVKVGQGCEVVKVQTCYFHNSIVFATQKGLPYRGIISHR